MKTAFIPTIPQYAAGRSRLATNLPQRRSTPLPDLSSYTTRTRKKAVGNTRYKFVPISSSVAEVCSIPKINRDRSNSVARALVLINAQTGQVELRQFSISESASYWELSDYRQRPITAILYPSRMTM